MIEDAVLLKDERRLAYAVYGNPAGWPVVYFHGTPSSRLELQQLKKFGVDAAEALKQMNLCLIAPDRPGMGLSTFNPDGDVLSCAADVAFLLQHLGVNQCSVLCWSGGGPYALALGYLLPGVVQNIQILCGFTRRFDDEVVQHMKGNKWYFRAARHTPALLEKIMNKVSKKELDTPPPRLLTTLPPVDYNLLNHPDRYKAMTRTSLKEACRNGAGGPVREAALYFNDFGFVLSDIQQPVYYWWGEEDTMVIRLHPEAAERQLPKGRVQYLPGEGHLSVFVKCFPEALQTIAGAASK